MLVILVDGVIGKVHKQVSEIVLRWRTVLIGGQAAEAFVVKVYSEGINTAKQHVNTEIKLESVDQKWLMQVPLNDIMFCHLKIFEKTSKEDAFPLARGLRF